MCSSDLYLKKFFDAAGGNKLSMAAIETLAIVAYRQPVTVPEVQEMRGKQSQAVIRNLLEKRLLRIAGRKEVVGRPFLYATTREFLMHFGLKNLGELPPLEEFEETFGSETNDANDLMNPIDPMDPIVPMAPLDSPEALEARESRAAMDAEIQAAIEADADEVEES